MCKPLSQLVVEVMWPSSMICTVWTEFFYLQLLETSQNQKRNKPKVLNIFVYFSILMNNILNLLPYKLWEFWQSNGNRKITTFCVVKLMAIYQNQITGFFYLDCHVLIKTKSTRFEKVERYKKEQKLASVFKIRDRSH